MPTTATRQLSDKQVGELLTLLKGADTVELKLTVPESEQRSAIAALGLDPLGAQIRQVYFFDTPDLELDAAGVVVRARRVAAKGDDAVVKLRPVVPDSLSRDLRRTEGFGVEVDAMPGGFVCSATLKRLLPQGGVRETVMEGLPLRKLYSKQQRAFFAEHAPEGVGLDDLSVLGPIFVLKLKHTPPELRQKLVVEMWLYPDDSRIVELSTKCATNEAFQTVAELRAYLGERGIDTAGAQSTKTRRALEFFSAKLRTEAG